MAGQAESFRTVQQKGINPASVRLMTSRAFSLDDGVVGGDHGSRFVRIIIVTTGADLALLFYEQIPVVGRMRLVAGVASALFVRRMKTAAGSIGHCTLVAGSAKSVSIIQQEGGSLGSVRGMTTITLAYFDRRVNTLMCQPGLRVVVTLEAQFESILHRKKLVIRSMR